MLADDRSRVGDLAEPLPQVPCGVPQTGEKHHQHEQHQQQPDPPRHDHPPTAARARRDDRR